MFKKMHFILLASFLAIGLVGCNTMAGVGKDLQRGGQEIQKSAAQNSNPSRSDNL